MQVRRQNVFFILMGVLIGLTIFTLSVVRAKRAQQFTSQKKEIMTSVPEIISCANSIKVLKGEIRNADRPDAIVTVEVENTSDVGIIAISIESKKGLEAYNVIENTFGTDEPVILIEPHATHTLKMELANVHPGVPLQIGSVVFADGTEEGCKWSLKSMRETKTMHEAERAKRKAKEPR